MTQEQQTRTMQARNVPVENHDPGALPQATLDPMRVGLAPGTVSRQRTREPGTAGMLPHDSLRRREDQELQGLKVATSAVRPTR